MDREKADKIFIVLLLILVLLMSAIVYFVFTEGKKCTSNPFSYSASKLDNSACTCYFWKDDDYYTILFNKSYTKISLFNNQGKDMFFKP